MPVVRAAAVMRRPAHRERRKQDKRSKSEDSASPENKENIGACGNKRHDRLSKFCARVRDNKYFVTSLIGVIVLAGILVGIQTYHIPEGTPTDVLNTLDGIVLIIFIVEIVIKVIAEGKRPWAFFYDGWNCFDFTIVAVGLMPFGGDAITALRLVRLLRVLKLVRALPKLRILVMGLLLSMSSIAYIGMLLLLLFYLYAVLGVSVFAANDPVHFGSLHMALITLFRCATLEDWTDVMYIAIYGCDQYGYTGMEMLCVEPGTFPIVSVIFFCTFVILSSMMILNLFIGVITTSMQEAKTSLSNEADEEHASTDHMSQRIRDLGKELGLIYVDMKAVVKEKHIINKAAREEARRRRAEAKAVKEAKRLARGDPGGSITGSRSPSSTVSPISRLESPSPSSDPEQCMVSPIANPNSGSASPSSRGEVMAQVPLFQRSFRNLPIDRSGGSGAGNSDGSSPDSGNGAAAGSIGRKASFKEPAAHQLAAMRRSRRVTPPEAFQTMLLGSTQSRLRGRTSSPRSSPRSAAVAPDTSPPSGGAAGAGGRRHSGGAGDDQV